MKKCVSAALLLVLIVSMFGCSNPPTRGVVKDGVYTNTYFGLSFKLPDGWQALTDQEILDRYSEAMATNEELASKKMGFGDGLFYKTADETIRMNLWYDILYGSNATNEQIKNRLMADNTGFTFGDIKSFKIGEADYSMISSPNSKGTYNIYFAWSNTVTGYLRPMIYIVLGSGDSIDDILSNFSQISK